LALSDQIRKRRQEEGLSVADLARLASVSKAYISQLENNINGVRPSANVLFKIASALGTSINTLLEKDGSDQLADFPEELQKFALAEQLPEEEIKLLARIEYRGRRPKTVDDWKFLYEAIKRSVAS
jgi:transcriptional regulator with XRE-family HTH domain